MPAKVKTGTAISFITTDPPYFGRKVGFQYNNSTCDLCEGSLEFFCVNLQIQLHTYIDATTPQTQRVPITDKGTGRWIEIIQPRARGPPGGVRGGGSDGDCRDGRHCPRDQGWGQRRRRPRGSRPLRLPSFPRQPGGGGRRGLSGRHAGFVPCRRVLCSDQG